MWLLKYFGADAWKQSSELIGGAYVDAIHLFVVVVVNVVICLSIV